MEKKNEAKGREQSKRENRCLPYFKKVVIFNKLNYYEKLNTQLF